MSPRNCSRAAVLIGGLLATTNAMAVVLGTDPAREFAAEIADGTLLTDPVDIISFPVGYNFSAGEVRYGRLHCSANIAMDAVALSSASTGLVLGAVNGMGTNAVFFSLTANPAPGETADDVIDVDADVTLLGGGDVDCLFSLYDHPSQAAAGAVAGRIHTTGWQPLFARPSGYVFQRVPGRPDDATIDVEALAGPYFGFTTDPALFGNLRFEAATGVLDAAGNQVTLAGLFDPATSFTIEGDFSTAQQVSAFNLNDATTYLPDVDEAGKKTFTGYTFDFDADLRFVPTGARAIPESDYYAQLHPVANPGYVIPESDPVKVGAVVRNGTQLQAPLAQVPGAGWLSRMVLTNSGGLDRPYEISVVGENGNTIATRNTTGVLHAFETLVIELDTVMTAFTPGHPPRGTLNVHVSAPNQHIQGLYQIVNSNEGSVSNHVMVRPATN